jgi:general secretion pathway protein D
MLVSAAVSAQNPFDSGGPGPSGVSTGSWTDFKFNPKTTVKLSFHNAGIDPVIEFYEKASGITIVKDPGLKDTITLTSAKPVPIKDAMQIFVTELGLKGYDVSKEGTLLVIKSRQQQRGAPGGPGAFTGFDPSMFSGQQSDNTELKVYPIEWANASQVARVLNDVFSGTGPSSTQNRPGGFGGGFGGRPGFGGGGFGGGRQTNPMQQFFQAMAGGSNQQAVKASADDYSNAVIVNASPKDQIQVASLIKSLDKQTDEPQQTQVFHLLYASATDLAPTVSTILVQNVPRGKGGLTATNIPPQQQFQQALRFGGSQTSFGQVTADTRTNSLVVVATPENLQLVDKVIHQLDVAATVLDTTFVFPLSNAKATDVATLFQQAFGMRQGLTGSTIRPTTSSTSSTNNNNNNFNNNGGNRPSGLGGTNLGTGQATAMTQGRAPEQYMPLALEDPTATSGPLQTNIDVTQGFFGGGGGGQRPGGTTGSSAQTQAYRTPSGEIVNVRDLTNQITVIPDPNTNSLIVVAPPDDATVVRNVLDQLDKIPDQVMIETVVAEASLDATDQLGVEWNYAPGQAKASQNFGLQSTSPPLQGFTYTLTGSNYGAYLNALQTDTKFKVLSTPRIFTANNQQATINISQSLPYVLSSVTDATTGAISYNYAFENVGIILTVTPTTTANGYVTLVLTQTADELQSYTSFNAPIVNQREAQTTVQVKDGETVILGGIMQDQITSTVNKIPILGDIPLVGNLFKSTSKADTKTELLVFLTPRVVRNVDDARKVTNDSRKELSPELQKNLSQATKSQTSTSGTSGGGH